MILKHHPLDIFKNAIKGKPGCLFCDPIPGMAIHETDHFRVLMDTFPIIPGHLMISSKAHYGSAGEIPDEMQQELIELKHDLKEKVKGINGDYIFYEHGRAGCCMKANPNGQKCEHFHLHCLPVDVSLSKSLSQKYSCIPMESYEEIMPLFLEHGNYLYFEETSGKMCFFPAEDHKVESHLLRSLICNSLGIPNRSDWQSYEDAMVFMKSYELIANLVFQQQLMNV